MDFKIINVVKVILLIVLDSVKTFLLTFLIMLVGLLFSHVSIVSAIGILPIVGVALLVLLKIRPRVAVAEEDVSVFKQKYSYILEAPRIFYLCLQVIEIVILILCLYSTYYVGAADYEKLHIAMESSSELDDNNVEIGTCVLRALPVFVHKPIAVYYDTSKSEDDLNSCLSKVELQKVVTILLWLLYGSIRYPGEVLCDYIDMCTDVKNRKGNGT